MKDFINIGDSRIVAIKTKESEEKLVDLRNYGIIIDESRRQIANKSEHFTKVRKTIAEMILKAQKLLPENIDFLVKEGYRPVSQQMKSYKNVRNYFQNYNIEFDEDRIILETNKLCAPIEVAPHPTGAAIDLTLIYKHNNSELDLGTEYNAVPHETDNATFINANNISDEAKGNRKILIEVMESAGFICYPSEWWHWSYGDKYWAFCRNEKYSVYSMIEEECIEKYL